MAVKGEGSAFVLKTVWVTKLADISDGIIAREDGRFLGQLYDLVARRWFGQAVSQEVQEIARLLAQGERGRRPGRTVSSWLHDRSR